MSTAPLRPHANAFLQAGAQCVAWALGMGFGTISLLGPTYVTTPLFYACMVGGCIAFLVAAAKIQVLRRRSGDYRRLKLTGVRANAMVVVLAVLPWIGLMMLRGAGYGCVALVGWPLLVLTLDRIAAPASVAWESFRVMRHRRSWKEIVVSSCADGIVIFSDESGIEQRASAGALNLGRGYVRLAGAAPLDYRHSGLDRVEEYESVYERKSRRAFFRVALRGTVAGLGWLAIWVSPILGRALCAIQYYDWFGSGPG